MTKDVRQSWDWNCSMAALGDGNQTWRYFRTDSGDIGERLPSPPSERLPTGCPCGLVEVSRLLK